MISTIGGKIAIVECTTKISDFQSKLGKLVDRHTELVKVLGSSGHHIRVDAFLVCALPRAQIAVDEARLIHHRITLLSKEDLQRAFDLVRGRNDPDEWLDRAAASLDQRRSVVG